MRPVRDAFCSNQVCYFFAGWLCCCAGCAPSTDCTPVALDFITESVIEVIMKIMASQVVARVSTVAAPHPEEGPRRQGLDLHHQGGWHPGDDAEEGQRDGCGSRLSRGRPRHVARSAGNADGGDDV